MQFTDPFSKFLRGARAASVVTVVTVFLVATSWGQSGNNPAEPPSPSTPFYLDSSKQLVPLEPQTVRIKHDFHNLGFSGGSTVYQIEGGKSPVRLKGDAELEFVVRIEGDKDPLETIQFYRFNGVAGLRLAPIDNFSAFGRVSALTLTMNIVDFNAEKYGSLSFRVVPTHPLAPGEYCLIVNKELDRWPDKSPGFCFGIEAGGN